jgi:hypothetical protein
MIVENRNRSLHFFIIGLTVLSLAFCLFLWSWTRAEREKQIIKPFVTYARLMNLGFACDTYKEKRGSWPRTLAELVEFQPELSPPWSTDAWGKDFILIPCQESLGYGQVISYGRDGKPGGDGLDRDLVVRFPCKPNETWNAKQGEGLPQPRIRP